MTTPVLITCLDASQASEVLYVRRGFRLPTSLSASLTTALGSNADLTYLSKLAGTAGNAVTVAYTVGSALTAPTVSVTGSAIVVNITSAATNTVTTSGTPASVLATGTVTTSGTGAANNDTLVVGATTYTFKTALTGAANEVLRTGVEDVDLTNLALAINAGAGIGTNYGTGTVANASATAGSVVSHVLTLTAKSYLAANGNAVGLSKTGAVLTVSGATFSGGTNETVNVNSHTYTFVEALDAATANEVLINGQDVSLTNLAAAINGSAGAGTTYGTGTVANTDASSSAVAAHAITLTAKVSGSGGNSLTLAVTGSHLARGGATFSNGGTTSGAWSTTANAALAAIQASTPASALVDVRLATGQNGTGNLSTLVATSLAGGSGVSSRFTGAVISGVENETVLTPGVIYEVDVDDPQSRKILARYYQRWFEVPGGDITKVPVRTLLLSQDKTQSYNPTGSQSFISRGTPVQLAEILGEADPAETDIVFGGAQLLDLTQPEVRRAIRQHRDMVVSAAGSTQTLITIRGLVTTKSTPSAGFPGAGLSAGRGFRINKYGAISQANGANNVAYVNSTSSVQVDLSDFNVRRALRRNIGKWIVVSAP